MKVAIFGLDNAGKTSVIKTLIREFKSLDNIKPTKGIERTKFSFLGKEIIFWDYGGQKKYQADYAKKPEMNFSDISQLIYVIDSKDQTRFTESINYFQDILKYIKQFSSSAVINIFFNKIDPGMESDGEFAKMISAFGENLTNMAKPLSLRTFQTSIFNDISIIRAFSKPLFENTTLYDNFSILFMDIVNKGIGIDFIMVLSSELLEIGNYFTPVMDQKKMKAVAKEIIKTFDDKKMKINDVALQAENYSIHLIKFEAGGKVFYFTYGCDVSKNQDISAANAQAYNVFEDVKKFMKYF
jgi:hypothetical protein